MMIKHVRFPKYGVWLTFGFLYIGFTIRNGKFYKRFRYGRDRTAIQ